jgi:GT2 family glycosyltransferase
LQYVRRQPVLQALEHFNRCIDQAEGDYFCLFHDDDLMGANFVSEMKKAARAHHQAIALGCNAVIEVCGKPQTARSFRSFRSVEVIDSARDLATRYFARSQSGIAPFPGYVYNKHLVGSLRLPTDGGKYADVTWLLNLARQSQIVWINKPLITYRLHDSNDSKYESRRDRLRSLGYLKKNLSWLGSSILQDYRCSFIYKTVLKSPDKSTPNRLRVAAAFLKRYRWTRYARLDTHKALVQRALAKWLPKQ